MLPDLIYLKAKPSTELSEAGLDTVLYSDCNFTWSQQSSSLFQFVKTILLYFLPFLFMFAAHFRIMKTLRLASEGQPSERISIHLPQANQILTRPEICHIESVADPDDPIGSILSHEKELELGLHKCEASDNAILEDRKQTERSAKPSQPIRTISDGAKSSKSLPDTTETKQEPKFQVLMHNKAQLESRRKAAKMLMLIVFMFGICYLPVHLINFLR